MRGLICWPWGFILRKSVFRWVFAGTSLIRLVGISVNSRPPVQFGRWRIWLAPAGAADRTGLVLRLTALLALCMSCDDRVCYTILYYTILYHIVLYICTIHICSRTSLLPGSLGALRVEGAPGGPRGGLEARPGAGSRRQLPCVGPVRFFGMCTYISYIYVCICM